MGGAIIDSWNPAWNYDLLLLTLSYFGSFHGLKIYATEHHTMVHYYFVTAHYHPLQSSLSSNRLIIMWHTAITYRSSKSSALLCKILPDKPFITPRTSNRKISSNNDNPLVTSIYLHKIYVLPVLFIFALRQLVK